METIGQAINFSLQRINTNSQSSRLSQDSILSSESTSLDYSNIPAKTVELMKQYNISAASRIGVEQAYSLKTVSLYRLVSEHGEDKMILLLYPHLVKLCQYAHKNVPDEDTLMTIAQQLILSAKSSGYSLEELLYFFNLVKQGEFGEFIGAFDGIKLLTMLKKHKQIRKIQIEKVEAERKRQLQASGEGALVGIAAYNEYRKKLDRARQGDPDAQRWFAEHNIPYWEINN